MSILSFSSYGFLCSFSHIAIKAAAYYNLLIKRNIRKETQGKLIIYTKVLIYAKALKKVVIVYLIDILSAA